MRLFPQGEFPNDACHTDLRGPIRRNGFGAGFDVNTGLGGECHYDPRDGSLFRSHLRRGDHHRP